MDLILGTYATGRLASLDERTLHTYEALLGENDQELYSWITEQACPPSRYSELIADISAQISAVRAVTEPHS